MQTNFISMRRWAVFRLPLLLATIAGGTEAAEWKPGIGMTQAVGRVMGSVRRIGDNTSFGYDDGICIMAAFLRPGANIDFTRPLVGGQEYVILGGGDFDVEDLDIEIFDPYGRPLTRDVLNDPAPIVRFFAPATGIYTLRQKLFKARTGSFCVVAVLRAGGFDVPVSNLLVATTNLIDFCTRVNQNRGGGVVFHDAENQWAIFGSVLRPNEATTITRLALGQGRRVIVAAGDNNAADIDLFVLDQAGNTVVKDDESDATPIADIQVHGVNSAGLRLHNVQSRGPALVLSAFLQARPGWVPGRSMRESMIALLAPAAQIIKTTQFGFAETAYLGAFLRPGGFSFLTTTLNAGQSYAFLGAGNDPARDVDIIIEDESGKIVAQDIKDDAIAVVNFAPIRTQRYTLKLKLHAASAPCFCGMVQLRQQGWTVPLQNLDVAMDRMLAHCENIASQRPAKFLDVPGEWAVIGTIVNPGQSSTFSDIRLGSGRRAMTSGGDTVSRDIDLEVYQDGTSPKVVLDKDEAKDAAPLVKCTADPSKRYGVVIKNPESQGGSMIMTALLDVD